MESQQPPEIRLIGELFQTYILAEIDGMFVAVDKHAAHERILYEELKAQNDHPMERQLLLSPIRLTLSREEYGSCVGPPGTNSAHGIFGRKFWGIDPF